MWARRLRTLTPRRSRRFQPVEAFVCVLVAQARHFCAFSTTFACHPQAQAHSEQRDHKAEIANLKKDLAEARRLLDEADKAAVRTQRDLERANQEQAQLRQETDHWKVSRPWALLPRQPLSESCGGPVHASGLVSWLAYVNVESHTR